MPQDISRVTEYIKEKDSPMIKLISGIPQCSELYKLGKKLSMCGLGSAMLTIDIARNIGKTRGKLLQCAVGSEICDRGLLDQTGFASFKFL